MKLINAIAIRCKYKKYIVNNGRDTMIKLSNGQGINKNITEEQINLYLDDDTKKEALAYIKLRDE